ncbi:centrosomal protein of 85 kDa-like isoform X2 [Pundamilia nyererei]|uniref:Centrosomal protein of 85 kDa-like isoform X2 n=1 Tax=Pundamilia nyererei TaxID=303518 RepID=A0A9Y3VB73_9CICH|nr:PREDICTED: centrosomal protein of 85 kDa-like isoform X2 [Pundamilia nyererei]
MDPIISNLKMESNKTDDSSSSTTHLYSQPLLQQHLGQDNGIPTVHQHVPATSHLDPHSCLDTKDHQSIRRCSSLSNLSLGTDTCNTSTAGYRYNPNAQGSLDRVLQHRHRRVPQLSDVDLYLPLLSPTACNSLLQHSPGASTGYQYNNCRLSTGLEADMSLFSPLSSPVKQYMDYSIYQPISYNQMDSPLGHQTNRTSPVQLEARTQMWLTEHMEHRLKGKCGGELGHNSDTGTEGCGGDEQSLWQQRHQCDPGLKQMLRGTSLPVNNLVKVKEDLLRQREQQINRQKLQILLLHARIRDNEQKIHQVLKSQRRLFDDSHTRNIQDSTMRTSRKQPPDQLSCDEELVKKLAVAELDTIHFSKVFKQITQKYSEDIRKLEERIKTRDRYICSLKKKFQRENNQNQENQQRIETLEKYLSDLPTLDEVQVQANRQEEAQQKCKKLEKIVSHLKKSLEEGCTLMKDKDIEMKMQAKREKELIASVHSLQQKVQQCLDDGVRLPMQDLKRLEVENHQLIKQQDHSSKLFKHQREQIERLTSQLMQVMDEGLLVSSLAHVEIPEVDQLLKEMSLCLLDLQGLCSILAQRAQGKEPNLSLLLGMTSLTFSAEDSDCKVVAVEDKLRLKLLEVGQLRKDIDALRKSISDCYDQFMGDCISQ